MFSELKRGIFSKINIILIIIIFSLMFLYAYHDGWRTSLLMSFAKDLPTDPKRLENVIFIKRFYGNFFKIVISAFDSIKYLAPLFLTLPYLLSIYNEKINNFRYNVVCRKGNKKYMIQKVLAIVISGTFILAIAELLFTIVVYFMTYHDKTFDFLDGLVLGQFSSFFHNEPYQFIIYSYLMHVLYYFAFLFFAIGITSFLKHKIAIIITPFIASTILEAILPKSMQPNVTMHAIYPEFNLGSYFIIVVLYIIVGIFLTVLADQLYLKKGS